MTASVEHGGSLARARALFPRAPEPWVDLSTGISPVPYPVSPLPATALTRLPEPGRARELCTAAAAAYCAPAGCVIAAPGTQILLPRVYSLVRPGRALVLGPTYAEHTRTAAIAGHDVSEVHDFDALAGGDVAVVVNPNNPDGRIVSRAALLDLAATLAQHGGLLVVDEAFMDVGPREESLCGDVGAGNIVVLRSFGKFFGLAGVRLGFAVAAPPIVARLDEQLGPWAVNGPALEYGIEALSDLAWRAEARVRLDTARRRLDAVLAEHGLTPDGGTSLFRHLTLDDAPALFQALGENGVLVRSFSGRPHELRIGLPGSEAEWSRLAAALARWRESGNEQR